MAFDVDDDALLNSKRNLGHINLALRVVNVHDCTGALVGAVDVLFEVSLEAGSSLGNAAAGADFGLLVLLIAFLELDSWLADHQHLLGFDVSAIELDLDVVLGFGLGLLAHVFVLENKRRREASGQNEAEANAVGAWSESIACRQLLFDVDELVLLP